MPYKNNHFSPVLAKRWWVGEDNHYVCYYRDEGVGRIQSKPQGKKQWGSERTLWPQEVEFALSRELETPVGHIYSDLFRGKAPEERDRAKWAQFLLSQAVRTPTFMRYEKVARDLTRSEHIPAEYRVCYEDCLDSIYVTGKDWAVLVAHEDDFFVRTDNPVIMTGFLTRPETAIFYRLTPRLCFVACPKPPGWIAAPNGEDPIMGTKLLKGGAHMINFYAAKHCADSLVS